MLFTVAFVLFDITYGGDSKMYVDVDIGLMAFSTLRCSIGDV